MKKQIAIIQLKEKNTLLEQAKEQIAALQKENSIVTNRLLELQFNEAEVERLRVVNYELRDRLQRVKNMLDIS